MRATTRSSASSPQPPTADDRAAHHNEVIQAGMRRADELEPRLAAILEPILRQAGMEAAHLFETQAVDWLAASGNLKPNNGPAGSPGIRTPGVTSMSTMVALVPRADEAAALEHQQIPADELHVTLCYLGEVEGDLAPVVAAVAQAASAHAPLEGKVAGIAAFEDTGKGNPSIVLPSVPGLTELRVAVTEALAARGIEYSRDYGYVPHMTVQYGEAESGFYTFPSVSSLGQPLHFDSVYVVRGNEERHEVKLTGARPITAAAGGYAWERLSDDEIVRREIQRVAREHHEAAAPDYGRTYWNPAERSVLWVAADYTDPDDADAAAAAFLEIDGVDSVEVCDECGRPDGYEVVFAGVRQTFGLPGDDDGVADESPTAEHPGKNLPVPADDPAAMGPPSSVGYRTAATEGTSCATCSYYSPGTYYRCGRFDVFVDPGMVCNAFDQALVEPIDGQDDWTEGDDMIGELLAAGGDDAPSPVTLTAGDGSSNSMSPFLTAAAGGKSTPAPDELVNVDKLVKQLRTKTDPVRVAIIQSVMAASLANVGLEWDATNPFVAKILAQTGSQIRNIAETTQLNVMRIIKAAYEEGLTIPDTAKAIRVGMKEASITRATLIARTELAGAVNGGSVAATQIVSEATGVEFTKTWHTSVGANYPRHEDYDGLDGQTVGLDDYFDVGGFQLGFPGDPDGPPEEVCNCFPATTSVVAPGLEMGFRRRYEGELVRVEVMGMGHLSGTPNHPVLTSTGWKPLGFLREGDHLVCAVPRQDEGAVDPDVDDGPAAIHQVFGSLASGEVPSRIRGRAVQFHGDSSTDGEVEVVAADGYLRRCVDAADGEESSEFEFVRAGEAARLLAPASLGLSLVVGDGVGASSRVRGHRELTALSRGETPHAFPHSLGAAARHDADLAERSVDDASADAVVLGQRLYGASCVVSLAQVVAVERDAFHGDVFNLQTESGTYLANGVIVHNCRCTVVYTEANGDQTEEDAG